MGVPIKSITVARKSAGHADVGESHTRRGVVKGVREHYNRPGEVMVEVAHGRRSKPRSTGSSKGKKGTSDATPIGGLGMYDNRTSSEHAIPKSKAGAYPVGRKVTVTIAPDDGGDDDEPDDDMGDDDADDGRDDGSGED